MRGNLNNRGCCSVLMDEEDEEEEGAREAAQLSEDAKLVSTSNFIIREAVSDISTGGRGIENENEGRAMNGGAGEVEEE